MYFEYDSHTSPYYRYEGIRSFPNAIHSMISLHKSVFTSSSHVKSNHKNIFVGCITIELFFLIINMPLPLKSHALHIILNFVWTLKKISLVKATYVFEFKELIFLNICINQLPWLLQSIRVTSHYWHKCTITLVMFCHLMPRCTSIQMLGPYKLLISYDY